MLEPRPPLLSSLGIFAWGVAKRWYYWAWFLLLDPPDFWGRVIVPNAGPWAKNWDTEVPAVTIALVFVSLLLFSAFLTFHAERRRWWKCESKHARIVLCKRLLELAPDTANMREIEDAVLGPVRMTETEKLQIENWLKTVESDLGDVGRFALLTVDLREPNGSHYFSVVNTKRLLRDYTRELS